MKESMKCQTIKEAICKSGENTVTLGDLEWHQKYLGISCQWQWFERHKVGRRDKSKHCQWQSQLSRIKVIKEAKFALRESSTSEKNCTEMTVIWFSFCCFIWNSFWEGSPLISSTGYYCTHWHEVTIQFRMPGQRFLYLSHADTHVLPQHSAGLEEIVFSWKNDLPVSAQEIFLSLHFLYVAEEAPLSLMALLRSVCLFSSCFINLLNPAPAFSI